MRSTDTAASLSGRQASEKQGKEKNSVDRAFIQLIQRLSDARGASGFEREVAELLRKETEGIGEGMRDPMNNFYVARSENIGGLDDPKSIWHRGERRLRIQLDAHMDEVGFMVQAILPNGTLCMTPIGGWVASNIPAHRVLVRRPDGSYIKGLTASKPPHYMSKEERSKGVDIQDIVVDVGTLSYEESVALGIEIGEPIVPDVQCAYDEERGLFLGKAFDCRSGCAAIVETLRRLRGERLETDVFAAFSTQEEVGTRGAAVTCERVHPDVAIVFEGCPADDTFQQKSAPQTAMGRGPMLRHLDARMITHPAFQRWALQVAKEVQIPVQRAVRTGGATNGAPIHLSGQGVPTIVIGVPVRYIHTHYGITSYVDHEASVRLAVELLHRFGEVVFAAL